MHWRFGQVVMEVTDEFIADRVFGDNVLYTGKTFVDHSHYITCQTQQLAYSMQFKLNSLDINEYIV